MTREERNKAIQYLVLCTHSELDELLRAIEWRQHRRVPVPEDLPRCREELIDIFKYWLSMALIFDMNPDVLIEEYWKKSAVVRHRFSEEYVKTLDRPTVVIDVDEVLCDFSNGMLRWLMDHAKLPEASCAKLLDRRNFIDASQLGIPQKDWEDLKHQFRTSGGFGRLIPMPGAFDLLSRCRNAGYSIVLLTSRPIERYPSLFSQTIDWLNRHQFPYDFIWWSDSKAKKLLERGVMQHVAFAIDDHLRYIQQFDEAGIRTYWFRPNRDWDPGPFSLQHTTRVSSLAQIRVQPVNGGKA
jgi:NTP pyrophosphatase (non-canonical NTP hydrolase)